MGQFGEVAGREENQAVAGPQLAAQKLGDLFKTVQAKNIFLAPAADGLGQDPAADTGYFLLVGGVQLGDHQDVGAVERRGELPHQDLQAREAMRLKDSDDPPAGTFLQRFQGGLDLAGMMGIIIDDQQ